ncbi:MAG: hypothetical protein H7843_10770 [Nitrospirota bacterium]
MDFSNTYITMCEKALFLQQAWEITYADYYCDRSATFATRDGSAGISIIDDKVLIDVLNQDFNRSKAVWLPRQDQFQELLNILDPFAIIHMLNEFTGTVDIAARERWQSMEQLLLCAYALHKHKKHWTGDNWI